jgi:hypothetical protein
MGNGEWVMGFRDPGAEYGIGAPEVGSRCRIPMPDPDGGSRWRIPMPDPDVESRSGWLDGAHLTEGHWGA